MKLTFILVGKIKEHFYEEGIKMYIKRISKYSQVEFINLDESRLSTSTSKIEIESNSFEKDKIGKERTGKEGSYE